MRAYQPATTSVVRNVANGIPQKQGNGLGSNGNPVRSNYVSGCSAVAPGDALHWLNLGYFTLSYPRLLGDIGETP